MKSLSVKSFALRWMSLLSLAALAACGGGSDGDPQLPKVFSSTLTGTEVTPAVNTTGKGVGVLVFHPDDRSFTATLVTSGVTDTAASINEGPPGVPGPAIIPMMKQPGSIRWEARGALTPDQEAKLRAGNYYFNVQSPGFPNGELRGQVTERALTPDQQRMLQDAIQQAGARLQQASVGLQAAQAGQQATPQLQQAAQQAQQAAQRAQQQAQQAGAAVAPAAQGTGGTGGTGGTTGGGTTGMSGAGTTGG